MEQEAKKLSRLFFTTFCSSLIALLAGCTTGQFKPSTSLNPAPKDVTVIDEYSEPTALPPEATTSTISEFQITSTGIDILSEAVKNLVKAASFEMTVHEVISYQGISAYGNSNPVYGEFLSNYAVIQRPLLKVYGQHEYRYAPQTDYIRYDSYSFQQNNKYFIQLFEPTGNSTPKEVEFRSIAPFSSDVYQTLIAYSDQARLVTETDSLAIYFLEHPEWFHLESAIGFADLGFLHGQENGEQLVEQYAAGHYPNVEPIEFTIYVNVDDLLISKVEVDNRAFMHSVWAEVDRALIEQGAEVKSLTEYVISDNHRAEYLFNNYNQVQDFDLDP
jgi:hypothetical protein